MDDFVVAGEEALAEGLASVDFHTIQATSAVTQMIEELLEEGSIMCGITYAAGALLRYHFLTYFPTALQNPVSEVRQ